MCVCRLISGTWCTVNQSEAPWGLSTGVPDKQHQVEICFEKVWKSVLHAVQGYPAGKRIKIAFLFFDRPFQWSLVLKTLTRVNMVTTSALLLTVRKASNVRRVKVWDSYSEDRQDSLYSTGASLKTYKRSKCKTQVTVQE